MKVLRTVSAIGAALMVGAVIGAGTRGPAERREPEGRVASALGVGRAVIAGALADGLPSAAAAIAFYALLSLVPAISVLISVYGLLTPPSEVAKQLAGLDLPVPGELRAMIVEQAQRIASTSTATLSFALATSIAMALWGANAAVKAMFEGLNRMWNLPETRSFFRFTVTTLGFTLVAVLTVAAMLAVAAARPAVLALAGERSLPLLAALGWPAMVGLGFAGLVLLYRSGPDRRPPPPSRQIPGALAATAAWVATSAAFSWYAATLGSYSATYGSLAGVIVVLSWAWLSAIIVLAGGAITAAVERGGPPPAAASR